MGGSSHPVMAFLLFCMIKKVSKKIKAVFKFYDFLASPGARKKLAPPASGLNSFSLLPPPWPKNRDLNKAGTWPNPMISNRFFMGVRLGQTLHCVLGDTSLGRLLAGLSDHKGRVYPTIMGGFGQGFPVSQAAVSY